MENYSGFGGIGMGGGNMTEPKIVSRRTPTNVGIEACDEFERALNHIGEAAAKLLLAEREECAMMLEAMVMSEEGLASEDDMAGRHGDAAVRKNRAAVLREGAMVIRGR